MKLGERRKLQNDKNLSEIWLTKWMPTKSYQVWGLVKDGTGGHSGWFVLFDGTLKEARAYARGLIVDFENNKTPTECGQYEED